MVTLLLCSCDTIYTATFVVGDNVIETKEFTKKNNKVEPPEISGIPNGLKIVWDSNVNLQNLPTQNVTISGTISPIMVAFMVGTAFVGLREYNLQSGTVVPPEIPQALCKKGYSASWPELTVGNSDVLLQAIFTPNQYTVTFDYSGATSGNATETKTVVYDQPLGYLPTPSKNNHEFQGWYYNGEFFTALTILKIDHDFTLTAVWENSDYTEGLEYELSQDESYYICKGLGHVNTPDIVIPAIYNGLPVTEIARSAFSPDAYITSVVCPDTIVKVGAFAFRECEYLESIDFGSNVRIIENGVLSGCVNLVTVKISSTIETIMNGLFYQSENVEYNLLDGVGYIGNDTDPHVVAMWALTNVSSYESPESVRVIYDYAFQDCSSLTNVTLKDTVVSVCRGAFNRCSNLRSVVLPSGLTELSENMFENCQGLTTFVCGEGITKIGANCFYNCFDLTNVTLSSNLTEIGMNAFYYCSSLEQINIPASVTFIGKRAFYGCTTLSATRGSITFEDYSNWKCKNPDVVSLAQSISATSLQENANLYLTSTNYYVAFEWTKTVE